MTEPFAPRLDILPPAQRRLWDELAAIPPDFVLPDFVLHGGTAIALQLGHRQSVDFDFFAAAHVTPAHLTALPLLAGATVTRSEPDPLGVIIDRAGPVSLSFFGVPAMARLRPPHRAADTGLRIASLLDLAGTEAAVVQQRAEAKDYLDIAALLADRRVTLPEALAAAQAIYGPQFNPQITLKALSYFDDGNLRLLPDAIRERLVRAVHETDLDRLPSLPPPVRPRPA